MVEEALQIGVAVRLTDVSVCLFAALQQDVVDVGVLRVHREIFVVMSSSISLVCCQ